MKVPPGWSGGCGLAQAGSRKVRTPKSMVPGNTRVGDLWPF
jgi:hypothetical protein